MRSKIVCGSLFLSALFSISVAQHIPLQIGEPAPKLNPSTWVSGNSVSDFQDGTVYVLVFWDLGYSPYAPEMPHLTDKLASDVRFISVNVWHHFKEAPPVDIIKHQKRVVAYLKGLSANQKYSVCLDNTSDSLADKWLPHDGSQPGPKVAIVDRKGQFAWVGQPNEMERPLIQICRGTFNMAAFKVEMEDKVARIAAVSQIFKDFENAAKANDSSVVDGLILKLGTPRPVATFYAIYHCAVGDPEFALRYLKSKLNKVDGIYAPVWCNLLSQIATFSTHDETKREAVRISSECLENSTYSERPYAEAYHAQTLAAAGEKDHALLAINQVRRLVETHYSGSQRSEMTMFVNNIAQRIR